MLLIINQYLTKIPVLKRIYPSILSKLLIILNKNIFIVEFKNLLLRINIKDPIDKIIFYKNSYEEEQIKFIKSYINKNKIDSFIDIGSNIGIYSLIVSKNFKKIEILSFEPVLNTFNNLNYNIRLNSLTRKIRTFNFGLSNRSGTKKMIALKKKNYIQSGGYSFYIPKRKIHKNEIIEHYKSKIGDSVIKFKNKNIIIKIDVEGFEKEVLYGLKKLLSQNKILIQIEIFQRNFNKINKILNKHKFKLINQIKNSNDFYYTNN
jgi:FkbM family methyltransferase